MSIMPAGPDRMEGIGEDFVVKLSVLQAVLLAKVSTTNVTIKGSGCVVSLCLSQIMPGDLRKVGVW